MSDKQCFNRDSVMTDRPPLESSASAMPVIGRLLSKQQKPLVDNSHRLNRIEKLARWMDSAFRIPGTSLRIGLDSLIGLVPGVGDFSTFVVGCLIIREAWILKIPKRHLLRMTWNTTFDAVLGSVPLVGDLFDFAFKSNSKNAGIILDHFHKQAATEPADK